jgi:D-methionine transport system substrate-binding protein
MKKILPLAIVLAVSFGLFACGSSDKAIKEGTVLKVAADAVPHAEILEFVKPALAEQGVDLQIFITSEWTLINTQTNEGQYDANYFQHLPFLESAKEGRNLYLEPIAAIHIEPISLYSRKYAALSDLPQNAKIAVPNDPSNEYRALALLEKSGFIKLRPGITSYQASKLDIVEYLKPVEIIEADPGLIVRAGDEFDAYITNTNRILEFNVKDPVLVSEDPINSPFANLVVVRTDRQKDPAIQALIKALQTQEVRDFINEKYKGAVVPAF